MNERGKRQESPPSLPVNQEPVTRPRGRVDKLLSTSLKTHEETWTLLFHVAVRVRRWETTSFICGSKEPNVSGWFCFSGNNSASIGFMVTGVLIKVNSLALTQRTPHHPPTPPKPQHKNVATKIHIKIWTVDIWLALLLYFIYLMLQKSDKKLFQSLLGFKIRI